MSKTTIRIISDIAIFFGIMVLPWWLIVAALIICLFAFSFFYEVLLFGLMIDSLYGIHLSYFHGFSFVYTTGAVVFFIVALYLKRIIKFYSRL